jgi:hypothetical protein
MGSLCRLKFCRPTAGHNKFFWQSPLSIRSSSRTQSHVLARALALHAFLEIEKAQDAETTPLLPNLGSYCSRVGWFRDLALFG